MMFVQPGAMLNVMSDSTMWAKRADYAERFEAIRDWRTFHDDVATTYKPEFRSIASITVSLEAAMRLTEPGFLKDKRTFYKWLDDNKDYCTYTRRVQTLPRQMSIVDGKVV